MGIHRWPTHAVTNGVEGPAHRSAHVGQLCVDSTLKFRGQTQTAITFVEMHPSKTYIELCFKEFNASASGVMLFQQLLDQIVKMLFFRCERH